MRVNRTADDYRTYYSALSAQLNVSWASAAAYRMLMGATVVVGNQSSGDVSSGYGSYSVISQSGAGTLWGAAGPHNKAMCFQGTAQIGYAVFAGVYTSSGGGAIQNGHCLYADYDDQPGHVNMYGLYVTDQAQCPSTGQNWNVYSEDVTGNSKNHFGGRVSVGNTSPSPAAKLQVDSTTAGLLQPRMTTAQRTASTGPPEGLLVYDTDAHGHYQYTNAGWAAGLVLGTQNFTAGQTQV